MSMLMISEARPFWGTDAVAPRSQFAYVNPNGDLSPEPVEFEALRGKSIIVLVHGYNNTKEIFVPAYFQIKKELEARVKDGNKPLYDAVIGYHTPLCDETLEYFKAQGNVTQVAERVCENFVQLASVARSVDVIAHSMGNRVMFEALKGSRLGERVKIVHRLFCFAPAVDNETVQRGDLYAASLKRCSEAMIFYSKRDGVLKGLYPLAEWDKALGYDGAEDASQLPSNTQQIDCTEVVDGHAAYLQALPLYDFIRDKALGKIPDPQKAHFLKFMANGKLAPLQRKSSWFYGSIATAIAATGVFSAFAIWLARKNMTG